LSFQPARTFSSAPASAFGLSWCLSNAAFICDETLVTMLRLKVSMPARSNASP